VEVLFVAGIPEKIIQFLEEEAEKCEQEINDKKLTLAEIKQRLSEEKQKLNGGFIEKSNVQQSTTKAENDEDKPLKRFPSDMLKPEFKGLSSIEIAQKILSNHAPNILTNDALTNFAYDTQTEEEFLQARNSFASLLRMGSGKFGWEKVGRGQYRWTGFPDQ
jgi:hypothetical protein